MKAATAILFSQYSDTKRCSGVSTSMTRSSRWGASAGTEDAGVVRVTSADIYLASPPTRTLGSSNEYNTSTTRLMVTNISTVIIR